MQVGYNLHSIKKTGELLRVQEIANPALRLIRGRLIEGKNHLQVLGKFVITHDCYFYSEVLFLNC